MSKPATLVEDADDRPAYAEMELPPDKPLDEYTTDERRARVLQACIKAGSPDKVYQTGLAEEHGVTPPTIHRDLKVLRDDIEAELGVGAELLGYSLFRKAINEKVAEGDWEGAVKLFKEFYGWLFDTGAKEREPERREVAMSGGVALGQPGELDETNAEHFDAMLAWAEESMEATTHDLTALEAGDDDSSSGEGDSTPDSEAAQAGAQERTGDGTPEDDDFDPDDLSDVGWTVSGGRG